MNEIELILSIELIVFPGVICFGGFFATSGPGELVRVQSTMNKERCLGILKNNIHEICTRDVTVFFNKKMARHEL